MDILNLPNYSATLGFIERFTEVVRLPILPEISLRLLTERSPMFFAKESDLEEYGIKDPFFLFCWPGGQAISRFVLDNRNLFEGKSVLVIGAGCGVEAIASVMAGAKYVLASDIDTNALIMSHLNMQINGVNLDLTDRDFLFGDCSGFDIILMGDMFYDSVLSGRIMEWIREMKNKGSLIIGADPLRGNIKPDEVKVLGSYKTIRDGEVFSNRTVETVVFTSIDFQIEIGGKI